jgi:macrophage erythroblast attacher
MSNGQGYFDHQAWDKLALLFVQTHHALLSLPQSPLLHIALAAGLSALKTPACHSKYISPTSGVVDPTTTPTRTHHQHTSSTPTAGAEAILDPVSAPSLVAAAMLNTPMCPICSTELNKLASALPFAHHNKSSVENDPVVLPNGRIYGRERLQKLNEKLGTPPGMVRDPSEPSQVFREELVRKVFIM